MKSTIEVLDVRMALYRTLRLEACERELIHVRLKWNTVLETDAHAHGKAVHQASKRGALLVHVDEDLAQHSVVVLARTKEDLVPSHTGLLREATSLLGEASPVAIDACVRSHR
jgi:hypothetical protein